MPMLDQYSNAVLYTANMKYDINSLDDLVAAFEGPKNAARAITEAAAREGLSAQAVCHWKAKGYLPPSRHLQIILLLKRLGKYVNPAIFDCTEEDWRLLGLLPDQPT